MTVVINPQRNLPLMSPEPDISLSEQTQVEAIAALAELFLQVWEKNRQTANHLEEKIDE